MKRFFEDWKLIWKEDWVGKTAVVIVLTTFLAVIFLVVMAAKDMIGGYQYTKQCRGICQTGEYLTLPKGMNYPVQGCYCEKDITQITKR